MADLVQETDATLAQMAIAWCMKNKDVSTVILGASSLDQLKENLNAMDVYLKTDKDVFQALDHLFSE